MDESKKEADATSKFETDALDKQTQLHETIKKEDGDDISQPPAAVVPQECHSS